MRYFTLIPTIQVYPNNNIEIIEVNNYVNDNNKFYLDLFKKNPYIHDVILDKRLSRFNLIYLYSLMKSIKKLNFQRFN